MHASVIADPSARGVARIDTKYPFCEVNMVQFTTRIVPARFLKADARPIHIGGFPEHSFAKVSGGSSIALPVAEK